MTDEMRVPPELSSQNALYHRGVGWSDWNTQFRDPAQGSVQAVLQRVSPSEKLPAPSL